MTQGLILPQNGNSVTKDGTKGKEEAWASRHAKKNGNNEVELWGATVELGNEVCCCGNKRQAKFHTKMTKCIADCAGRESNEDVKKSVNDGTELNLMEPTEPAHKTKKHKKDLA